MACTCGSGVFVYLKRGFRTKLEGKIVTTIPGKN